MKIGDEVVLAHTGGRRARVVDYDGKDFLVDLGQESMRAVVHSVDLDAGALLIKVVDPSRLNYLTDGMVVDVTLAIMAVPR